MHSATITASDDYVGIKSVRHILQYFHKMRVDGVKPTIIITFTVKFYTTKIFA
jgi:hypothetical protein